VINPLSSSLLRETFNFSREQKGFISKAPKTYAKIYVDKLKGLCLKSGVKKIVIHSLQILIKIQYKRQTDMHSIR
jgi:hypothetical protein